MKPSDSLTINGETKSLNAWAAGLGCPVQTIMGRLQRGWDPARAVSEAVGKLGGSNRGKKFAAEILTALEVNQLLVACSGGATGIRNRAMIVIGWRAGLRITEAIKLEPKDLDENAHTIRILMGKGKKSRTVGLDVHAWEYVRAWLDVRSQLPVGPKSTLFCTLSAGRLSDRYVRDLMPRLAAAAGIEKRVHFHGLRHTVAFELAQEGVPVHLIQQQLGHSNLAITSKYINHLNPAETIARMQSRTWGEKSLPNTLSKSPLPPPNWLTNLVSDIGDRLQLIHDARTDADLFKAVVLLF